jgi:cupin 2 domain-containing protein
MPQVNNLFAGIPSALPEELFQELLKTSHFRLERIISHGQASPPGFWYDEPTHEWVVLLSGRAALKFADRTDLEVLNPGDYLLIPAGCRHRVEWTDPEEKTVWLALHYR